jgi:hypothetical protein
MLNLADTASCSLQPAQFCWQRERLQTPFLMVYAVEVRSLHNSGSKLGSGLRQAGNVQAQSQLVQQG